MPDGYYNQMLIFLTCLFVDRVDGGLSKTRLAIAQGIPSFPMCLPCNLSHAMQDANAYAKPSLHHAHDMHTQCGYTNISIAILPMQYSTTIS